MSGKLYRPLCLLMLIMAVAPNGAWGQEGNASITGRVEDSTGAVIPGVGITLTSTAVMGLRENTTDERGGYRFSALPPGAYSLKFELPGFRTLIRERIQLTAGFTATINAQLEVATVADAITVTGQSPVVDTQSSAVGVNFTTDLLENLPNARDVWAALAQTPGVVMTSHDVGGSRAGTQTGYRTYGTDRQNWVMVDGIVITESNSGVGMYNDYGSFQEIQVVGAAKGAEAPTPGAYTNMIVKTGSNDLHGQFYQDWEDDSFQSNNITDFLKSKGITRTNSVSRYNDWNAQAGGPIVRDKVWWFFSWRHLMNKVYQPGLKEGACATVKPCTDRPTGTFPIDDGVTNQDAIFFTELDNYTLKLNYQLTQNNSFAYTGQRSGKHAPFQGGFGPNGGFFNTNSLAQQLYPGWFQKWAFNSVLKPTVLLDASINNFGYHWPQSRRVNEISRRDLDTRQVRGGFSGTGVGFSTSNPYPFNNRRGRWHYDVNLGVTTNKLITGTHNLKFGYTNQMEYARFRHQGTIGHFILYYRGGFQTPAFIDTQDTPFETDDRYRSNTMFVNDRWNITQKLTLNLGFRFTRGTPYYRAQEKKGDGPFQERQVVAKRDLITMVGAVPRFSLIYDVFGTGKTAIKTSYGRYTHNPGEELAKQINPMVPSLKRYNWDGILPFNPAGKTPVSVIGGRDRDVDPNLKYPYTDEYTFGLDQELMQDLSLRVNFVRKFDQNMWQIDNIAIPYEAYNIPIAAVDPGRDNVRGTNDDKNLTFFSLDGNYLGKRKDIIRNNNGMDNAYTTYEADVVKRFSNKWQMIAGWNYLHRKIWSGSTVATDAEGIAMDPNRRIYTDGQNNKMWTYKLMGTYEAPYGVSLSSVFRASKGEPYGRRLNSPSLSQGVVTVYVEPIGTFFNDSVYIVDFRAEKSFNLGERWGKLDAMFDLFNLSNSSAIVASNDLTGATFGQVTQTMVPRIFRIGMRYSF